jgi:diguanylate cyclase (GGDEF)-like protein
LADHVSLALSDARTVEQMRLAMHDSLTGLASRPLFLEKLAQRLEDVADQSGQVAVLFVDLDRFKLINDTAGHSTGDRLLAEVGRRISHSLRGSDVAARFGGDEFAVLLSGRKCLPWAIAVADRLLADLSAPFSIDDRQLYTGASIGIAVSCGPVSAEDLMRDADVAMYQAKQKGRGRYSVFQPDMRMWFFNRVQLESELRHALDASQLLLHYQPVVSLEQGTIVGAEALLRWQHPKRGLVPPLDFIPLAEEAGLMTVIGAWVLDEACREAVRWQHLGTPQFISVNVSAGQVHKGTLADDVARALAKSGLPPGLLTLEFTESLPLMDDTATRGRLQHLKELGVKLAIDDFGTGYSSLSYLRRLPLDYLKIDRSLINDVGTDAGASNLAQAVVRLGHTMGLAVVAEGVEGQSQADTLRQAGCELGQGYLFARPMPAYAFAELLSSPAALPDLAAIEVGTLTRSAPIP